MTTTNIYHLLDKAYELLGEDSEEVVEVAGDISSAMEILTVAREQLEALIERNWRKTRETYYPS